MNKETCWYRQGLCFSCQRCGKCCGGVPGDVFFSKTEGEKIALYLKISIEVFYQTYARTLSDGRLSLKERLVSFNCIFLHDRSCLIYPVRPLQCQTFPWWKSLLRSKEAWEEEAKKCPGINAKNGVHHSFSKIQKQLARNFIK